MFAFNLSTGQANIALNMPTEQSSTMMPYTSDRAVNGKIDDYTHTTTELPKQIEWWKVNLGARYNVRRIKLFNRQLSHQCKAHACTNNGFSNNF